MQGTVKSGERRQFAIVATNRINPQVVFAFDQHAKTSTARDRGYVAGGGNSENVTNSIRYNLPPEEN